MSWTCISCSQKHIEKNPLMGFGFCKTCQENSRFKKAQEREAILAINKKKY